jgi:hypothetical protein
MGRAGRLLRKRGVEREGGQRDRRVPFPFNFLPTLGPLPRNIGRQIFAENHLNRAYGLIL